MSILYSIKIIMKTAGDDKLTLITCAIQSRNNAKIFRLAEFVTPQSTLAMDLYGIMHAFMEVINLGLTNYPIKLCTKNKAALFILKHLNQWKKNKWSSANGFSNLNYVPSIWVPYLNIFKDLYWLMNKLTNSLHVYYTNPKYLNPIVVRGLAKLTEQRYQKENELSWNQTLNDVKLKKLINHKADKAAQQSISRDNVEEALGTPTLQHYLNASVIDENHFNINTKMAYKRLKAQKPMDIMTFFPEKYTEIDTLITNNLKQKLADGAKVSFDVVRTGHVITEFCLNGTIRISFPCQILGTSNQIYFNSFGLNSLLGQFNAHYLFRLSGTYNKRFNNITVTKYQNQFTGQITPHQPTLIQGVGKYTSRHGVPQEIIRELIMKTYKKYHSQIHNLAPKAALDAHGLFNRQDAIFQCHFPSSKKEEARARYTEKYNELYQYVYKMQLLHAKRKRRPGFAIKYNQSVLNKFTKSLPYTLTKDQQESVKDILFDLSKKFKMSRLLQGDVGSGKTVVAAYGALATIKAGYQVALMIPTTVLGGQHYQTFTNFFKDFNVHIALLTGKTSYSEKKKILANLKNGKIDMIIGTEALYQKKTQYHKLGLVIVDEQHRFGVKQRRALSNKTKGCNMLSMTATPIPRTLAIAIYGDMDVSQIRHKPKGRKPIQTKFVLQKKNWPFIIRNYVKQAVKKHEQTFVIAKLVKPTKSGRKHHETNAMDTYKFLKKILTPDHISVGLVHGQMNDDDKNKVLDKFAAQKFDVLVATSVVEVGVDIPHADLMIILNAEHYGLAQLHQLRGRVGRNSQQAYCILIGNPKSKDGKKRMKVMTKTDDGFKVAQADLKIRHAGNIFGRSQSGMPDFKLADLRQDDDVHILQVAKNDANHIIRHQMAKGAKL